MKRSKAVLKAFQLSLRVRHPSMDPADLTREFEIKPQHCFRVGDSRSTRTGSAAHSESYWLGELNPAEWPADIAFPGYALQITAQQVQATAADSFSWALSSTTTVFFHLHAERLRRIRAQGGQISLLVALSAGQMDSFSLQPEVCRACAEFGITIEFELADERPGQV